MTTPYFLKKIQSHVVANSEMILDGKNDVIKTVSISEMRRQNRYSSRIGGKCLIEYQNPSGDQKRKTIWIKRVEQPEKFFNVLSDIYKRSVKQGIHHNITKPYWYDSELGIVAMAYFNGTTLLWATLKNTHILNNGISQDCLILYQRLGEWLQQYHKAMTTNKVVKFHKILNQIIHGLNTQTSFSKKEVSVLCSHLDRIGNNFSDSNLCLVKPHNDFTIRNIIISNSSFAVIDWDAAIHPKFPEFSCVWNDISYFLINLQSLFRFYPFISEKKLGILIERFKNGYFKEDNLIKDDYFQELFFLFTLRIFLGIDSDRSLPRIYHRNLHPIYMNKLRKYLINGRAQII